MRVAPGAELLHEFGRGEVGSAALVGLADDAGHGVGGDVLGGEGALEVGVLPPTPGV